MKNFLYREDYAPVCPAFANYSGVYANLQQRISVAQPVQQQSIKCLVPSISLVFYLCHDKILYRNKIKSPE